MSSSSGSGFLRRIFWRLVFIGLFVLIGWATTIDGGSADSQCSGSQIENWFDRTSTIINNFDYSYSSANNAYNAQIKTTTPDCLEKLQEYTLDFYYNVRESERAYNNGEFILSGTYADKALEAYSKLEIETDRLAQKYGWE